MRGGDGVRLRRDQLCRRSIRYFGNRRISRRKDVRQKLQPARFLGGPWKLKHWPSQARVRRGKEEMDVEVDVHFTETPE